MQLIFVERRNKNCDLRDAYCMGCGYALYGLTKDLCPECGVVFSRQDQSTFLLGRRSPPWPKIPKEPSTLHVITSLLIAAISIYWSSTPGGLAAHVATAFVFIPIGVICLVVLIIDYYGRIASAYRLRRMGRTERNRHALRWFMLPLSLTLAVSAWSSSWPLYARFAVSKTALEDVVFQAKQGVPAKQLRGQHGLFHVSYIRVYANGDIFLQTGFSGFDKVGLLFSDSDEPRDKQATRLGRFWFTEMW